MGRAQGKLADSFTGVFGNLRGLRSDQEAFSSAPSSTLLVKPSSFTHGVSTQDLPQGATIEDLQQRRMELANWLSEYEEIIDTNLVHMRGEANVHIDQMSDLLMYSAMSPLNGAMPTKLSRREAAQGDLEALVDEGICREIRPTQEKLFYNIRPLHEWAPAHQEALATWQKVGGSLFY